MLRISQSDPRAPQQSFVTWPTHFQPLNNSAYLYSPSRVCSAMTPGFHTAGESVRSRATNHRSRHGIHLPITGDPASNRAQAKGGPVRRIKRSRSFPGWVSQLSRDSRPARPRLPPPGQVGSFSVPADPGRGLDDDKGLFAVGQFREKGKRNLEVRSSRQDVILHPWQKATRLRRKRFPVSRRCRVEERERRAKQVCVYLKEHSGEDHGARSRHALGQ